MKLFDSIIEDVLTLTKACQMRSVPITEEDWPMADENNMILRSEMAYELGADLNPGYGVTLLTDSMELVEKDEIFTCGKDLREFPESAPYARIAIVRVTPDALGQGNALYNAIRKLEYVRYHFSPEGFMMRVSASKKKESVRISKEAINHDISFAKVGKQMIRKFHENVSVEAVKLIYVTNPAFDFSTFEKLLLESENITETIDHMLKDVKMDCDVCNLKPVCDEVEGLRELHFAQV